VTLSHRLGRIGLLERENAALLNAALAGLARDAIAGFRAAIATSGIDAPLHLTQNDGTVTRRDHTDPIEAVLDEARGKVLFRGKVVDVARRTTEGFLRGTATVEGLDDDRGSRLKLAFQNEWVVAWRDGAPIAMSPDLICVLDTVSGNAFGTETIRYGMRVTVIALPAPAVFLSPKGLQHVGPRAFGYDIEFNSVFA
jgi:DUF917 family protein